MNKRIGLFRAIVVPYVLSRAIVLSALYTTRHLFTSLHIEHPLATSEGLLSWDASWYRVIARDGYDFGAAREGLRFFPLFPMLGRAVSWLPGVSAGAAVVLVANAAALVLGYLVYQLVVQERGDTALAQKAVWLMYLAPPAYVLVMGYAEALFLVLSSIVLLALRKERWWIAALAGLLAGLTRPVGVLLAIPAAVEGWRRREWKAVAPIVAPGVGSLAYLAWAARNTHEFFYPLRVQNESARRGGWVDPVRGIAHNVGEVFSGDHATAGIHVVAAVIFLGLLYVLFRRWPLSFSLYAAAGLFVALSSRNLDSMERYGLATVPFVLAGADIMTTPERERIVLVATTASLVAASVLAFTGVLVP